MLFTFNIRLSQLDGVWILSLSVYLFSFFARCKEPPLTALWVFGFGNKEQVTACQSEVMKVWLLDKLVQVTVITVKRKISGTSVFIKEWPTLLWSQSKRKNQLQKSISFGNKAFLKLPVGRWQKKEVCEKKGFEFPTSAPYGQNGNK